MYTAGELCTGPLAYVIGRPTVGGPALGTPGPLSTEGAAGGDAPAAAAVPGCAPKIVAVTPIPPSTASHRVRDMPIPSVARSTAHSMDTTTARPDFSRGASFLAEVRRSLCDRHRRQRRDGRR